MESDEIRAAWHDPVATGGWSAILGLVVSVPAIVAAAVAASRLG
jgi:hypothetical protein